MIEIMDSLKTEGLDIFCSDFWPSFYLVVLQIIIAFRVRVQTHLLLKIPYSPHLTIFHLLRIPNLNASRHLSLLNPHNKLLSERFNCFLVDGSRPLRSAIVSSFRNLVLEDLI